MNVSQEEKRTFSRVECLVDLEVTSVDSTDPSLYKVEAADLSLSGLGVTFTQGRLALPVGSRVLVRIFGFPPVRAVLCWSGETRAGFRFFDSIKSVTESWVGDVLAAQGVKIGEMVAQASVA